MKRTHGWAQRELCFWGGVIAYMQAVFWVLSGQLFCLLPTSDLTQPPPPDVSFEEMDSSVRLADIMGWQPLPSLPLEDIFCACVIWEVSLIPRKMCPAYFLLQQSSAPLCSFLYLFFMKCQQETSSSCSAWGPSTSCLRMVQPIQGRTQRTNRENDSSGTFKWICKWRQLWTLPQGRRHSTLNL